MMDQTASRIARNSVFVFAAKASELVSGIILVMLAARYLGVKNFGEYAFIKVLAITLSPVITFGLLRILIREISVKKEKADALVCSGLIINGLMAMAVWLIAIFIAFVFGLTSKVTFISFYLALLSQVLMVMTKTVSSVFIAYEKMSYDFTITIIVRLLGLPFFIAAIFYNFGLIGLFAALVFADAIGLFAAVLILSYKFPEFRWHMNFQHLIYLFKESVLLAISSFLNNAYTQINVLLLKIFRDSTQVSLFLAPQRIIQPLLLLPRSFLLAYVPALSRMAANDESYSDLQYAYHKMLKYILILTLPICVFGTVYASRIVLLVFGKEFSETTYPFQILIWAIVPLFANILLDFLLISLRRQNVLIVGNALCLMVSCTLGVILVQRYGYIGACWATLLSYVILVVCNFYFVSKHLGLIPVHLIALKPILSCSVLGTILLGYSDRINMIILILTGLLIYTSLLFFMKTFTKEELSLFKHAFAWKLKALKI